MRPLGAPSMHLLQPMQSTQQVHFTPSQQLPQQVLSRHPTALQCWQGNAQQPHAYATPVQMGAQVGPSMGLATFQQGAATQAQPWAAAQQGAQVRQALTATLQQGNVHPQPAGFQIAADRTAQHMPSGLQSGQPFIMQPASQQAAQHPLAQAHAIHMANLTAGQAVVHPNSSSELLHQTPSPSVQQMVQDMPVGARRQLMQILAAEEAQFNPTAAGSANPPTQASTPPLQPQQHQRSTQQQLPPDSQPSHLQQRRIRRRSLATHLPPQAKQGPVHHSVQNISDRRQVQITSSLQISSCQEAPTPPPWQASPRTIRVPQTCSFRQEQTPFQDFVT